MRRRRIAARVAAAFVTVMTCAAGAGAQTGAPPVARAVDAVAVRFYAAETGGADRPRFVSERVLAFEARLERMAEGDAGPDGALEERHVRAAVEHHVAEELLAALPHELPPTPAELTRVAREMRAALEVRVGGVAALAAAAAREGIAAAEVDDVVYRLAAAALYADRNIGPFLSPSEEQLRDAYRAASHPFRPTKFEDVRDAFARWLVLDRARALESQFFQGARSRVKIVYVR